MIGGKNELSPGSFSFILVFLFTNTYIMHLQGQDYLGFSALVLNPLPTSYTPRCLCCNGNKDDGNVIATTLKAKWQESGL